MTKSSRRSGVFKAKSTMQLSRGLSKADHGARPVVTTEVSHDASRDSGVAVNEKIDDSRIVNKKSEPILSKFGKRSASAAHPAPPPIPADRPMTSGMTKRKSFMSVFRK